WVSGSTSARLNGLYYSAPLSDLTGLTLRGSDDDNEKFVIDGSLNLGITVDGRGGNDSLQVNDQSVTGVGISYDVEGNNVTRTASGFILLPNGQLATIAQNLSISTSGIQAMDIRGSTSVGSTYEVLDKIGSMALTLTGGDKNDIFVLGKYLDSLSSIDPDSPKLLSVNGGAGADQLILDDTFNEHGRDYLSNALYLVKTNTISRTNLVTEPE